MSDGLLIAAIIFTILYLLVICGAIFLCFVICYGDAVGGGGIHAVGAPSNRDTLFNKLCTLSRWMCLLVFIPIIASIILIWLIYNENIPSTDNNIAFWIIVSVPLIWSIVACIAGIGLGYSQRMKV